VAGETPLGYLEATQDQDGGYTYPGNAAPDPFTTAQVPAALERLAFPIPFGNREWYPPGATLGTSPSSSATPTPSASPPASPPAGVITTPPLSSRAPAPAVAVQAASTAPGAAPPTATPAGTARPSPAELPLHAGAPSGTGTGGPAPLAPLIYAVVVLGVALVAGGARWVLVARR
jgi:hypothetical protein